MPTCHSTKTAQPTAQTAVEERLAAWASALVILGLSALSWAVLISVVMELRELLS